MTFPVLDTIAATPVPPFDPLGYPIAPIVIRVLAYFTLTLHFAAVNFTVGGIVMALWARWRKLPGYDGAARFLGGSLTLGVSYLVTFGIPPLLFVQLLYGQFFYSSSVVVGSFWIMVIPLVIAAYTGLYYHRFTAPKGGRAQGLVLLGSLVCFLTVGYIYSTNLTLSITPEKWLSLYSAHPAGGSLATGEPTVHPRLLAVLSPALAVAGCALVLRGAVLKRWGMDVDGLASQRLGSRAYFVSAALAIAASIGLSATFPDSIRAFVTSNGTTRVLLVVGASSSAAALATAVLSVGKRSTALPIFSGLAILVAVACAVVLRDLVRLEYLRPYFSIESVPVNVQAGMLVVFGATFVAGFAFLVVTIARLFPRYLAARRTELGSGS